MPYDATCKECGTRFKSAGAKACMPCRNASIDRSRAERKKKAKRIGETVTLGDVNKAVDELTKEAQKNGEYN